MLRIYTLIWSVVLLVAAVLFLSGNFTMLVGVVFGFIAFGLIFAGMMCVLPYSVGHDKPTEDVFGVASVFTTAGKGVRRTGQIVRQWLTPSGVEIRKPRFH